MTYDQAFSWLVSQEGVLMSDTRARTILSFARDAGYCPANSDEFLLYADDGGYAVLRDPAGVRRFQEAQRSS